MNKLLAGALAALALVLVTQRPAQAWSKFNFGVGLNIACEGGGNSFLWGLARGANVPGAYDGMGGMGPGPMGPGMGPDMGHAMGPMGGDSGFAAGSFGAPAPFAGAPQGPAQGFGGDFMAPGAPLPAPAGHRPGGNQLETLPVVPGVPAPAPASTQPRPMPLGTPSVAQPVGYFPYADPAVGYYPGYYGYYPGYSYYPGYYGR